MVQLLKQKTRSKQTDIDVGGLKKISKSHTSKHDQTNKRQKNVTKGKK